MKIHDYGRWKMGAQAAQAAPYCFTNSVDPTKHFRLDAALVALRIGSHGFKDEDLHPVSEMKAAALF
eukprot:1161129-Pelagomonas_calceolata.AAC.5